MIAAGANWSRGARAVRALAFPACGAFGKHCQSYRSLLKIFPFAEGEARMLGLPPGKQRSRGITMAKSQLRGNREVKKPKQPKKPAVPAAPFSTVQSRVGNEGAAKKKT